MLAAASSTVLEAWLATTEMPFEDMVYGAQHLKHASSLGDSHLYTCISIYIYIQNTHMCIHTDTYIHMYVYMYIGVIAYYMCIRKREICTYMYITYACIYISLDEPVA